jgi:Asp/Glu/hydantoin racemase
MHLVLINPNTSHATTAVMVEIASDAAGARATITGLTARSGSALILDEPTLAQAEKAVLALAADVRREAPRGVIVSAFGDPGHAALQRLLAVPVTGIAEAGMAEAGRDGRRFAVVTTTPHLEAMIARSAERYSHRDRFAGTWLTAGDPADVMSDPARLVEALGDACRRAIAEGGADAIVIGGGPLALAARALSGGVGVRLVEPVPAAVELALARAEQQAGADTAPC